MAAAAREALRRATRRHASLTCPRMHATNTRRMRALHKRLLVAGHKPAARLRTTQRNTALPGCSHITAVPHPRRRSGRPGAGTGGPGGERARTREHAEKVQRAGGSPKASVSALAVPDSSQLPSWSMRHMAGVPSAPGRRSSSGTDGPNSAASSCGFRFSDRAETPRARPCHGCAPPWRPRGSASDKLRMRAGRLAPFCCPCNSRDIALEAAWTRGGRAPPAGG